MEEEDTMANIIKDEEAKEEATMKIEGMVARLEEEIIEEIIEEEIIEEIVEEEIIKEGEIIGAPVEAVII
jgi:hypothetical protein